MATSGLDLKESDTTMAVEFDAENCYELLGSLDASARGSGVLMKAKIIIRFLTILALLVLYVISFPKTLGLDPSTNPLIMPDPVPLEARSKQPLPTKGASYERLFGRTCVIYFETSSQGFAIVLWKGSVHFQVGPVDSYRLSGGFSVARSGRVFKRASDDLSSFSQVYADTPVVDFIGIGYIQPAPASLFPLHGLAIPLWLGLIALVVPWKRLIRMFKIKSRGFEIVQENIGGRENKMGQGKQNGTGTINPILF